MVNGSGGAVIHLDPPNIHFHPPNISWISIKYPPNIHVIFFPLLIPAFNALQNEPYSQFIIFIHL
jgi:hypothetical protein